MKRVLIPVDGSAKSLEAVRAVTREGPQTIARVDLVNVQPLFNRHVGRWLARERALGTLRAPGLALLARQPAPDVAVE